MSNQNFQYMYQNRTGVPPVAQNQANSQQFSYLNSAGQTQQKQAQISVASTANNKPTNAENNEKDEVQGILRDRTHLIELHTNDPDEGPRLISDFNPKGIPIIVYVDPPSCCYFKLNVPHGIESLEQKWGRHAGTMIPGYFCCYCSYKRIAAMITRNAIQFNAPIINCPTRDNVRVTVDVSIEFHIGMDETREKDCEQFLYYLGATQLEVLLISETEENIRNFVRSVKVESVRELKSEVAHQMVEELNMRFNKYGVYVTSCSIFNVIIPKDLRIALQQATTYDVFLQNQVKIQENLRIKLMNEENKTLLTLKRENQKKMLQLNHDFLMQEIYLQKFKVVCETEQQQQIIKAKQNQDLKIIQAQAQKEHAEQRGKKLSEQLVAEAKAYAEAKIIEVNSRKINMIQSAQTRLQYAKLRSNGLMLEGDAEGSQTQNLQNKRQHEERMASVNNFVQLVKENSIIIGGKTGEEFLNYFKETQDLINQN
ncbi:UNKNOWN [Stylonychia lemnae]|uniref:Band 7 domain-containing protein n=1 Tax=Stylonychia lemnae TaxID=5949 RepID=A0A078A4J5_STYLE|nr:UNKNOWN [Stylonychia lemnae]|eukprot:CDW76814.1 UNKNOWN [Stylonychia lemnae]